jgi:Xaa-Pro aminopeptidase
VKRILCVFLLLIFGSPLFALERQPNADYRARRVALGEKLNGGAAILFAAEEPQLDFTPYRQDSDFYYFTGWNEPGAAILIIGAGPASHARMGPIPAHEYREVLFLPTRNRVLELYTGEKMDAASPNAKSVTGFDEVLPMTALPGELNKFVAEDSRRSRNLWAQPGNEQAKSLVAFTGATLGTSDAPALRDVGTLTMQLRAVKSPAEIEFIRKATNASIAGQLAGIKAIHPGVTERSIAGIEIAKQMEHGCERPSYAAIVGSGANSTTLHYSDNSATMQSGDVVVIDEACEYSMYASDITRTMPVNGHFSARQREIYEIVLGAQRAAQNAFVAGKFKEGNIDQRGPEVSDALDKIAYDYINTHGKDLHGQPLGKYFIHGLGHSVGLDVHDPFDYTKPLDKGMVFTIEPGIYIPEEKLGVRIEDIYYVDAEGRLVQFTAALPHTADEIEAAMQ